jgi:hypothetical protein
MTYDTLTLKEPGAFSVSVSYVINDTSHAVLVPSVLVYPMSLMTTVMLSWCIGYINTEGTRTV